MNYLHNNNWWCLRWELNWRDTWTLREYSYADRYLLNRLYFTFFSAMGDITK